MAKTKNNVLVALMNSKVDFEIAKKERWYRIPVKSAPPIIRNDKPQLIAFYQTKIFEIEKYSINYYGIIDKIRIVKRKELFPLETPNYKSEQDYYKIEFLPLIKLENPIVSKRGRLLVFFPTSKEKFFKATEINHLFNDSILEDILWDRFSEKNIAAERQLYYKAGENNWFILDFAIFCKTRNINVECDGDKYHLGKELVQKDKTRNNFLESKGWSVLRFTTQDLTQELDKTLNMVCDTINKYGGVQDVKELDKYLYVRRDDDLQLFLFEEA